MTELHLKIAGTLQILLAGIHFIFPKYFKWKQELATLNTINRQMMYVHTFFIAFIVFLMGIFCVTSSLELAGTGLGRRICLGLGFFWILRLFVQFFGYSPSLWKGKKFETTVHVIFSVLWIYFSFVFLLAASR